MSVDNQLQLEFAQFAGELAESIDFNKSIGQIFGLLYIHSAPLSLDEISTALSMSKGNASLNLRVLEEWGAVHLVSVSGSRRDHYEANANLREIMVRRLREGLRKRLDIAERRLAKINLSMGNGALKDPVIKNRLQELNTLISNGRKAAELVPKLMSFLS